MKKILDFSFCCTDQAFCQKTDRQKCFIGFGFWEEERYGKGLLREIFGSYNFSSDLSIIFTETTKSTLNKTLLFCRAVGG